MVAWAGNEMADLQFLFPQRLNCAVETHFSGRFSVLCLSPVQTTQIFVTPTSFESATSAVTRWRAEQLACFEFYAKYNMLQL